MRPVVAALFCLGAACSSDEPARAAAVLAIESGAVDFGVVEVGISSPTVVVVIRNVGSVETGVVLSTDTAELAVPANDCVTLAPQATCTASLRLTPARRGDLTHELRAFAVAGDVAVATVTGKGAYRLSVERSGSGVVTSVPPGIECGATCSGLFVVPTVELIAAPTPPATFVGWSGNQCSGTGACSVMLDRPVAVGAAFDSLRGLTVETVGMGAGEVVVDDHTGVPPQRCTLGSCFYPLAPAVSVQLTVIPLADSVFAGWSGACTGMGSCEVQIPADGIVAATATFAPSAVASLIRKSSGSGIALVPNGVIVLGIMLGGPPWDRYGFTYYRPDGTFVAHSTGENGRGHAIAVDASGAVVVAGSVPGPDPILPTFRVWRFTSTGSVLWTVAPGGEVGFRRNPLALDAAGNIYVAGKDPGGAYVASYGTDGVERWRHRPGHTELTAIAVRERTVVVGGKWGGPRLLTYDLDGNPGWDREVRSIGNFPTVTSVAFDSDGDILYGVVSSGSNTVGAVDAAGTALWHVSAGFKDPTIAVCPDDSLAVSVATDPGLESTLVRYREDGTHLGTTVIGGTAALDGLVCDAGGSLYLLGTWRAATGRNWKLFQRRP